MAAVAGKANNPAHDQYVRFAAIATNSDPPRSTLFDHLAAFKNGSQSGR